VGADLHFEGASNPRRGRVDSCSKILFQYNARREPLTFELLLLVVSSCSSGDVAISQPPATLERPGSKDAMDIVEAAAIGNFEVGGGHYSGVDGALPASVAEIDHLMQDSAAA
jgi:hypothetical protein